MFKNMVGGERTGRKRNAATMEIITLQECGGCSKIVPIETMVQCKEGHLFCIRCLERAVQNIISGEGQISLKCLTTEDCEAGFPDIELQRLPEDLRIIYERKLQDELLKEAGIENIARCPFCNFCWETNQNNQNFLCPNPACGKVVEFQEVVECGCCFEDVPIENMVQCLEAHLFCFRCFERYVQEAVFGQGQVTLKCLATNGCEAGFPETQLQRLPDRLRLAFEERIRFEALNEAGIMNIVRCPFCDFGLELDEGRRYFPCPNPDCGKITCRTCKVILEEHAGLDCKDIEKETDTELRKKYEERMTERSIRICNNCKASIIKKYGCNHMTCRCGTHMCYICRRTITNSHEHFCSHRRAKIVDRRCQKCKGCPATSSPQKDDEMAISELQKDAKRARLEMGYKGKKTVGAPKT